MRRILSFSRDKTCQQAVEPPLVDKQGCAQAYAQALLIFVNGLSSGFVKALATLYSACLQKC
jgi:hypothetical protein